MALPHVSNGHQSDTSTSNLLINMYSKCPCVDYARKVFDEMRVRTPPLAALSALPPPPFRFNSTPVIGELSTTPSYGGALSRGAELYKRWNCSGFANGWKETINLPTHFC